MRYGFKVILPQLPWVGCPESDELFRAPIMPLRLPALLALMLSAMLLVSSPPVTPTSWWLEVRNPAFIHWL